MKGQSEDSHWEEMFSWRIGTALTMMGWMASLSAMLAVIERYPLLSWFHCTSWLQMLLETKTSRKGLQLLEEQQSNHGPEHNETEGMSKPTPNICFKNLLLPAVSEQWERAVDFVKKKPVQQYCCTENSPTAGNQCAEIITTPCHKVNTGRTVNDRIYSSSTLTLL